MQTCAVDWSIWTDDGVGLKMLKLKHSSGSVVVSSVMGMETHCTKLLKVKEKVPTTGVKSCPPVEVVWQFYATHCT